MLLRDQELSWRSQGYPIWLEVDAKRLIRLRLFYLPMLNHRTLQEFKDLWLKEYGTPLTDEEAMEKATALLTLFDQIYRPLRKEWVVKLQSNS